MSLSLSLSPTAALIVSQLLLQPASRSEQKETETYWEKEKESRAELKKKEK